MSNLINLSIKESPKFRGAYEVHATYEVHTNVNGWGRTHSEEPPKTFTEVHPCHNYRTASDLCDRLEFGDQPTIREPLSSDNLELVCGCNTGGLGNSPAVTWLLTGRVEQVHNWATARTLADRHPAQPVLASAVF